MKPDGGQADPGSIAKRPTKRRRGIEMRKLLNTQNDIALTIARLALGTMILAHGSQKMLGLFGGFGFAGTMGFMTGKLGIPAAFAFLAIVAEFFGGIGLIVGGLTRVAAFGVACVMMVAVLMQHLPNGFFMNWMGSQKGEGVEFFILAIGLALVTMIRGAGALSLDRLAVGFLGRRSAGVRGQAVVRDREAVPAR
jgi:putative oxidoreductase